MLEMSIPTVECGTGVLHPQGNLTFCEDQRNKVFHVFIHFACPMFMVILLHCPYLSEADHWARLEFLMVTSRVKSKDPFQFLYTIDITRGESSEGTRIKCFRNTLPNQ